MKCDLTDKKHMSLRMGYRWGTKQLHMGHGIGSKWVSDASYTSHMMREVSSEACFADACRRHPAAWRVESMP